MKLKLPKTGKNKIFKKHKKATIFIIIILIAAALLAAKIIIDKKKAASSEQTYTEYTVAKGDIRVIISGSGTIEANEQYDITSLVTGDVLSANFEEGDIVEKDTILYEIDTKNVENSIEKAKNSVENAQMSYSDALEEVSNLSVKSPCNGVVTNVYIKKGDTISKGSKIADVIDDSVMILKIPFNENDANNLYHGQSITVRLDATGYELGGTITKISTGSTVSQSGVSVKTVEIEVNNPGTLKAGEKAIAYTSSYACNEAGTFDVNSQKTITAETSGDVETLSIGVGDKVSNNQVIAKLSSKSVTNSARKSELSYKDAQLNLDNLYETMDDYTIKAPISGTVISKETKAGDKLDNTNKSTVMAVIADMSRMLFTISVDELDIAKLEEGQTVTVTADALEGRIFTGYIDKISIIGTTSNGVTTYPVTVVVNNPEGLIPGMNVDATILVSEVKDVLTIPVSAVSRGNMVMVKSNEAPSEETSKAPEGSKDSAPKGMNANLPEGVVMRKVEVGTSNSDYVEIKSGLKEGDIILIRQTNTTKSLTDMMSGGMGGMGAMGGMSGPPAGMGGMSGPPAGMGGSGMSGSSSRSSGMGGGGR